MISTFGSDDALVKSVKKFEPILSRTRSFSTSDTTPSPTPVLHTSNSNCSLPSTGTVSTPTPSSHAMITRNRSNTLPDVHSSITDVTSAPSPIIKPKNQFQLVKRTGASIRNRVVKVRNLATGPRFGLTTPCRAKSCKCCSMCSTEESYKFNNAKVRSAAATCSSYNIIYLVVCSVCNKHYVGRSTRSLKERIGEHRRHYYNVLKNKPCDTEIEDQILGTHIYEHGFRNEHDFGKIYKVCVLEICSPKVIEVKEHKYIHRLNSLNPNGLNVSNPFSIPLLYK